MKIIITRLEPGPEVKLGYDLKVTLPAKQRRPSQQLARCK